jgi:hypothetical protein
MEPLAGCDNGQAGSCVAWFCHPMLKYSSVSDTVEADINIVPIKYTHNKQYDNVRLY